MLRTASCLAITLAAAGCLFRAVQAFRLTASDDPPTSTSPGVPGLDILQQIAASPPDVGESLQSAAWALGAPDGPPAAPVPATPLSGAGVRP